LKDGRSVADVGQRVDLDEWNEAVCLRVTDYRCSLTGTQRFRGVAEGSVGFLGGAPHVVAPREANPTRGFSVSPEEDFIKS
jgi:hypothetical protein